MNDKLKNLVDKTFVLCDAVDENDLGTASFRTFLIDELYKTDAEELVSNSKIEIL